MQNWCRTRRFQYYVLTILKEIMTDSERRQVYAPDESYPAWRTLYMNNFASTLAYLARGQENFMKERLLNS